jgi:hypothetical protein
MARSLSDQDINAPLSEDRPQRLPVLAAQLRTNGGLPRVEEETQLTREELYKSVWGKPATILAKELGISDVGLAKICKSLNVPRPPRGYWRRIEVGRKIAIPRLPPAGGKDQTIAVISRPRQAKQAETSEVDSAIVASIEAESLPINRIVVSDNLLSSHPLVSKTRKLLERGKPDDYARLMIPWNITDRQRLNLRVSKSALHRALRIANALIKALEGRGYPVEVTEEGTRCLINGEQVTFHVWEKVKRSEQQPTKEQRERPWTFNRWVYTPTGELTFVLDVPWAARKNWTDRKGKPLEDQLNAVVVGMIRAAEVIAATNRKWEEDRQRALEAERRRQEIELQRRIEEERRNELDSMAAAWVKSQKLRSFLLECESSLSAPGTHSSDDAHSRWLRWAVAYADSLDPFDNERLSKMVQRYNELYTSES